MLNIANDQRNANQITMSCLLILIRMDAIKKKCVGTTGGSAGYHLTLGFGSRHCLTVFGFEPHIGLYVDGAKLASVALSLPPSIHTSRACSPLSLSLSLSQNK